MGLLLAIFMASRLLEPIQATIKATRKISEGDFKQRSPEHTYKDLAELTTSVNDMAVNLEKNDLKRSSLFSDLAHDLVRRWQCNERALRRQRRYHPFNQGDLTTLKQPNATWCASEDLAMLAMLDEGLSAPKSLA